MGETKIEKAKENLKSEITRNDPKDIRESSSSSIPSQPIQANDQKPVRRLVKRPMTPEEKYKDDEQELMGATLGISAASFACFLLGQQMFYPFVTLSYPLDDKPGYYGKGPADLCLSVQFIFIMLFVRAFVSRYLLYPLSRVLKVKTLKLRIRFCEQGWQLIYGALSFFVGCYLLNSNPDVAGFKEFWSTYPVIYVSRSVKLFYIVQMGFWSSQMITLFLEQKRKDFMIMLSHHIVTIYLVLLGYYTHATFFGIAVHANMDAVDIFLPLSKLFKYVNFDFGVNVSFVFMFVTWIYTRHYMLCRLIYSSYYESAKYTELVWNPPVGQYWSNAMRTGVSASLFSLEILCVMWLFQIFQVIYNIIKGSGTNDVRSDDESEPLVSEKKKDE
ncbi:Sphingosine N-acyltransferase lag1 [Smittium mucronatum]|uniref:Sphingosine N-acyltransferase lag1 n=1 Tax=Smittium mucronatum TaxID=133383 RepID=A0A1R0GS96_9FUNG|nr:Sphingosine N-acyltransferase lag1 [Smittium mucronatum]